MDEIDVLPQHKSRRPNGVPTPAAGKNELVPGTEKTAPAKAGAVGYGLKQMCLRSLSRVGPMVQPLAAHERTHCPRGHPRKKPPLPKQGRLVMECCALPCNVRFHTPSVSQRPVERGQWCGHHRRSEGRITCRRCRLTYRRAPCPGRDGRPRTGSSAAPRDPRCRQSRRRSCR